MGKSGGRDTRSLLRADSNIDYKGRSKSEGESARDETQDTRISLEKLGRDLTSFFEENSNETGDTSFLEESWD